MFTKLRSLFVSVPLSLEEWAVKNSKKASAEEIIAAAIIQSFAVSFDKWEDHNFDNPEQAYDTAAGGYLHFPDKEIKIVRYSERKYYNDVNKGGYKYRFNGLSVDGVQMPKYLEKAIVDGWNKVAVRLKEAEAVNNRVKAEMVNTNKAWDMAEKLLGYKRNDQGALVPKETVE